MFRDCSEHLGKAGVDIGIDAWPATFLSKAGGGFLLSFGKHVCVCVCVCMIVFSRACHCTAYRTAGHSHPDLKSVQVLGTMFVSMSCPNLPSLPAGSSRAW